MTNAGFFWFVLFMSIFAGGLAMIMAHLTTGGPSVWDPSWREVLSLGGAASAAIFGLLYWLRLGGPGPY